MISVEKRAQDLQLNSRYSCIEIKNISYTEKDTAEDPNRYNLCNLLLNQASHLLTFRTFTVYPVNLG